MTVECFDTRKQFAVVATRNEHLGVRPHGRLQDRQRARCEFVFFDLSDLVFTKEVLTSVDMIGEAVEWRREWW